MFRFRQARVIEMPDRPDLQQTAAAAARIARHRLAGICLIALLTAAAPAATRAADCPKPVLPNIPVVETPTLKPEEAATNIDILKKRLNAYHDKGNYDAD